jgi:hypothetical protein
MVLLVVVAARLVLAASTSRRPAHEGSQAAAFTEAPGRRGLVAKVRPSRTEVAVLSVATLAGGALGNSLGTRVGVSQLACQRSVGCAERGLCFADFHVSPHLPGYTLGCRAETPAQCRASKRCRSEGECSLDRGRCAVKNAADCPTGRCQERGLCGIVDGHCAATTNTDCERSARCQTHGECGLHSGACVPTREGCARLSSCTEFGWCEPSPNGCVATAQSCRDSRACRTEGRCSLVGSECKSATDADCAGSDLCRDLGRCHHGIRRCEARTAADCRKSRACKNGGACYAALGLCSLVPARCLDAVLSERFDDTGVFEQELKIQVDPRLELEERLPRFVECEDTAARSCQRSLGCRRLGRCGTTSRLEYSATCWPTEPAHCEQSELCRRDGKCALGAHGCEPGAPSDAGT